MKRYARYAILFGVLAVPALAFAAEQVSGGCCPLCGWFGG